MPEPATTKAGIRGSNGATAAAILDVPTTVIVRGNEKKNFINVSKVYFIFDRDDQYVIIGYSGDDTLYGGLEADRIYGGTGSDILYGRDGKDLLDGGSGNDVLIASGPSEDPNFDGVYDADRVIGGDGIDTVSYAHSANGVSLSLITHKGTRGDAKGDVYKSIENVIGSDHLDVLSGNGENNEIRGLSGKDHLNGNGGDDLLIGGDGADKLYGSVGNDVLYGGDGADKLFGGNGDDILYGGAGADQLDGGEGIDTVDFSGNSSAVVISIPDNSFGGSAAGDTYTSIESVIGTDFADTIRIGEGGFAYGGGGDDVLQGGSALNSTGDGGTLRGDAGADDLHMEYGNTVAWLQRDANDADEIFNFVEGQDKLFIKLSDWGFGTTFDASEFRNINSGAPPSGAAQFILGISGTDAVLTFDADGDGAAEIGVATFRLPTFDEGGAGQLDIGDFLFVA